MNNDLFTSEIRKTGFVLENRIAQHLKVSGWTVISNKYYVDDSEEAIREIDLVAYKVSKVQHFDTYTVLIVSCKKSDTNVWALLARDINLKDPNSDWWPLYTWSNDKALQYQSSRPDRTKKYHEAASTNGVIDALSVPSVEVFAFQELNKVTGKPQNDKPIFSAITSLIKAQAYELAALPVRKKSPCVYQFNLLSVVDADIVRMMFRGDDITCNRIETEHFFTRYIIRKKEAFSRIRFIQSNAFTEALKDYDRLHSSNCRWFATECETFYKGIERDPLRSNVLKDAFKAEVQWTLKWRIETHFDREISIDEIGFYWSDTKEVLHIDLAVGEDIIRFLNESEEIRQRTARALKKVLRYDGSFLYVMDIPF